MDQPSPAESKIVTDPGTVNGSVIRMPCDAPAPLAMNGAVYVGCSLPKDHSGQHEVTVKWG